MVYPQISKTETIRSSSFSYVRFHARDHFARLLLYMLGYITTTHPHLHCTQPRSQATAHTQAMSNPFEIRSHEHDTDNEDPDMTDEARELLSRSTLFDAHEPLADMVPGESDPTALETKKIDEALDDGFVFVEVPDATTNDPNPIPSTHAPPPILPPIYTLPILATDALTPFINHLKPLIVKLLNECGAEWTALEFWYRGRGQTRREYRATVLIGVLEPEDKIWWEEGGVLERVREKVGGKVHGGMVE